MQTKIFFNFLLKEKTTRRNSKNMQKNILVWVASYAGGRSRGAEFNYLVRTRFELRSTNSAMKLFRNITPQMGLYFYVGEIGRPNFALVY